MTANDPGWAPQACTLPTAERPVRVAEFDELFATGLRGQQRLARTRLRWRLDVAAEAAARDLTSRESECCSFFTFTLAPAGRFDAHECPVFREAIDALIAGGGRIELDLSAVTFIDSSALSELVRARKRARTGGGDTVVVQISDPVRVILELTGLTAALTTGLTPCSDRRRPVHLPNRPSGCAPIATR